MKVDWITKTLHKRKPHLGEWDKIPASGGYQAGAKYNYWLRWEYNDNKIHVDAKDHDLIYIIEEVIKQYLECTAGGLED